ncbi:hypothetical protein WJX73_002593 [Symbiochloris irregularis]|uniref:Protein kinase domain-containing protein n=1 Tax=Symbiochloris irregularis TaxID=706552 RepID=A0AAW1NM52_9CHLO
MSQQIADALVLGKLSQVIKLLEPLIADGSNDATSSALHLLDRALCNERLGLHRKALKDYDSALQLDPRSVRAVVGKGRVLAKLNRRQEAEALWQQALTLYSPGHADVILEAQALLSGELEKPPLSPSTPPPLATPRTASRTSPAAGAAAIPNGHVASASRAASSSHSQDQSSVDRQPMSLTSRMPAAAADSLRTNGAMNSNHVGGMSPAALLSMQDQSNAVSVAVTDINCGRHEEALALLDDVIRHARAPNFSAHLVRGTGRAMTRDLKGAVEDFSVAIDTVPQYMDAWKRRGQARAALGDLDLAAQDLLRCLEMQPSAQEEADIRIELGQVFRRSKDVRKAAVHCKKASQLSPTNSSAWLHMGLCQLSLGDLTQCVKSLNTACQLDPSCKDGWFSLGHCEKEIGHVEEALHAFNQGFALDKPGLPSTGPMRILAHMHQCTGSHMEAVKLLTRALKASPSAAAAGSEGEELPRVDCLFLRGACYHALGYLQRAVQDYQRAFVSSDQGLPEESRQLLVLAYYQKELAQHMFANLDRPLTAFCADRELNPIFKELWCKKAPPSGALTGDYIPQPRIPQDPPEPPPRPNAQQEAALVAAADSLGKLLQYRTQGFIVNRRQHRMGGLAAIELAQAVKHLVGERRGGRGVTVQRGASGRDDPHPFGWRDAMDIVVKWRQLSEPNDQVIWVDLLSKAEFTAGFGSHTPMFSGQTKCVRYYMNFARGLELFKQTALKDGYVHNADSQQVPLGGLGARDSISKATTAEALHRAVGCDCWVVVPIDSIAHQGLTLEGTRLTLVQIKGQPDAYDFSIRTPVTPPRWHQYDEELQLQWEVLVQALVAGDRPAVAEAALRYAFLWYNFMPLARGTAVVGYITILAIFLAADMPVTSPIPKNYQIDWEAILCQHPPKFVASVSATPGLHSLPFTHTSQLSVAARAHEAVMKSFAAPRPRQRARLREESFAARCAQAIVIAGLFTLCRSQSAPSGSAPFRQQYSVGTVSELFTLMQRGQESFNVTITEDLHFTQETWPNTAVVSGVIFWAGNQGSGNNSRILDFGMIVNAIQVLGGATWGLTDVLITGLPWDARNTNFTSQLTGCESCVYTYPSAILEPNSTQVDTNVAYEVEPTHFNVSCPEWQSNSLSNKQFISKWNVMRSADGADVILASANAPAPVINKGIVLSNSTGEQQTFDVVLYGIAAIYCYETPEERPSTLDSPITLDHVVGYSAVTSGSSSGLGGGAIAGIVVGSVAGATILAALAFLVLRRLRWGRAGEKQKPQKSLKADLLDDGSSTSGMSPSSGSMDPYKQQWHNPLVQFQAAVVACSNSSHMSRAASTADGHDHDGNSSVGQLGGYPTNVDVDRCSMQFDWHIQPSRLSVNGGMAARPIGAGAYGVVYEGMLDGFKPVAIKFLHPATRPIDTHTTLRFMQEVDLLRACRDRNVVDFKGAWVQQDLVYMVTELMERDLCKAIAEEQASICSTSSTTDTSRSLGWHDRGSSIALDVLQGLHYLHSNNVVHLDIKSGNILLSPDGVAKIADVGLARTLSKSTLADHQREGTLAWQAPEMILGQPASFSADMWSFGVILLEIVTGHMPRRGQYSTPEVPDQCPQEIADLIQACMAPDPADRPTVTNAMQIISPHASFARSSRAATIASKASSPCPSAMTTQTTPNELDS